MQLPAAFPKTKQSTARVREEAGDTQQEAPGSPRDQSDIMLQLACICYETEMTCPTKPDQ